MANKTDIVKIDHSEYGLEEKKAAQIQAVFQPMLQKMVDLEEEYNEIIKLPIGYETCSKAKEVRLKYVKVRTETAKIHKETKAFYLNGGRFVDGWKNAQLFASQGIEEKLESIEKHYERKEQARKDTLGQERLKLLEPFEIETEHLDLGEMDDKVWDNYYKGIKATHEEELAAIEGAEKQRIAEEETQAQKVERMETISGMGMVWVEALDHYEKDGITISKEAVLNLDKDEFEMVIKVVAGKIKKAKKESDVKVKEQAKIDAAKQVESDKLAAELKTKQDAEKAETEVKKKAELAPDKDKLNVLASDLENFELPNVSTQGAQEIIEGVEDLLTKVANYITEKTEKL